MSIHLHRGDLPPDVKFPGAVAIDTETMGLNPHRDRLCLVQLSAGDGVCHLVQFAPGQYAAPNLSAPADRSRDPQAVSFRALRHRADEALSRRSRGAGLLHQDRLEAGPHLHRPARPQGSLQGAARRRAVEAAAILGLGRRGADRRAASLCRFRRPPPPCPARPNSTTCWRARGAAPWRPPASSSCRRAPLLDLAGWAEVDIFAH